MNFEQVKDSANQILLEMVPIPNVKPKDYFTDSKGNVHPITGGKMPEDVEKELKRKDRDKKAAKVGKLLAMGLVGAAGVKFMFRRGGGLSGLYKHEMKYTPGFAQATKKISKAAGTVSAVGGKIKRVVQRKIPIEKTLSKQAKSEAFLRMPANKALSREGLKALKQGKITRKGTLKKLKTEKPKGEALKAIKKRQELIRKLNPNLPAKGL